LLNVRVDDGRLAPHDGLTSAYEFAVEDRSGDRTVVLEWIPSQGLRAREMPMLVANGRSIVVPFHARPIPSADTPSWLRPLGRTALFIGLFGCGSWWCRHFKAVAWPERLGALAVIGWVAAGGWYWLVPAVAGVVGRASITLQAVNRDRRSTTSSSFHSN
jgi:hypothetical protein